MAKTKNTKRKVAKFDIDGTIFRSSLLIELTEDLIQEGIFPLKAEDIYKRAYKKWTDRKGSYEDYIMAVVEAFLKHINGVKYKDYEKIAKKVITFHRNRVYRFTRDLVRELHKKKYYLLAISHSPREIVKEFTKTMGFDKTYGWIYEVGENKKFTGKSLYEDKISDKAKILNRAVKKESLTLKNSIGVGDTESDIAFLKMVENPICFNPNQKLYRAARRRGWQIVVERKNMIYKL